MIMSYRSGISVLQMVGCVLRMVWGMYSKNHRESQGLGVWGERWSRLCIEESNGLWEK